MAIGDIIRAARFNNLQSRIETILGNGSGTDGYGQAVSSEQVSVNNQSFLLSVERMNDLYNDMIKARVHQTNSIPTEITEVTINNIVAEDDSVFIDDDGNETSDPDGASKGFADFERLMTEIETDKFLIDINQADATDLITSQRTTSWNGVLTHVVQVTFTDADARRHFFNSGGAITFRATLTGASGQKGSDWTSMLSNMGTISMNYNSTSATGTGDTSPTGSTLGNYDLTSSYQMLFRKNGSLAVYAENDYNVQAKEIADNAIEFLIEFRDDDTGDRTGIGPAQDENVNGTLTSTVGTFRATGDYVEVPNPSIINTSTL